MPSTARSRKLEDLLDHPEGLAVDRAAAAHARVHLDVDGHFGLRFFHFFLELPGKPEVGRRRG